MSTVFSPFARRSAFHSHNERIIAMPARIARSGSSSCATGRPKHAMIASPMNLSSIPPSWVMQSPIRLK